MSRNWLPPFYKWGKWGPERLCNLSKKVEPRLIPGHLAPGICSSSHPLSHWCYLALSFSATLPSFCLQSFLASGSFPMSRLFESGGQSIGASASASVIPVSIRGWFPLELTGLISLLVSSLSKIGVPQLADIGSFLYCRLDQLFWTLLWVLGTLKHVCLCVCVCVCVRGCPGDVSFFF